MLPSPSGLALARRTPSLKDKTTYADRGHAVDPEKPTPAARAPGKLERLGRRFVELSNEPLGRGGRRPGQAPSRRSPQTAKGVVPFICCAQQSSAGGNRRT